MKKTKMALAAIAFVLSTAAQAVQPAEQNANYHEVRQHSIWVWLNVANFCVARPYTLVCGGF